MCGRYTVKTPPRRLQEEFGLESIPSEFVPRFNVAPTQQVLSVLQDSPTRAVMLRWGLIPPSTPKRIIINARSETVAHNGLFRSALAARRCLVLADGFYEWRNDPGGKVPVHIRLRTGDPFAFAGLWQDSILPGGEMARTCAIITTAPNELVAPIHNRMPAILSAIDRSAWLSESDVGRLRQMLHPHPAPLMEAVDVNDTVNRVVNDGPECLTPRGTTQLRLKLVFRDPPGS